MSTTAKIAVDQVGGWTVARLQGELDMTNSGYVREELTRAVPSEARGMVADLGGAHYLDSAAIEMIFEMARRLARRRQRLRLVLPAGSPLTRVLELTDVRAVAPIHATVDAALAEQ
jgi:anti-sigma B factor antagonist